MQPEPPERVQQRLLVGLFAGLISQRGDYQLVRIRRRMLV